jgi:valyl-tRNA synthetase
VHRSAWPTAEALEAVAGGVDGAILLDTSTVLMGVRKAKSEAKTSMRTDVAVASVTGSLEALDRVALAADDLKATGRIAELLFSPVEGPLRVAVTL